MECVDVGHTVILECGGKDYPWLHSEFEATLEYMSCLSKTNKETNRLKVEKLVIGSLSQG